MWGLPVMLVGLDSPHAYYSYLRTIDHSDIKVINAPTERYRLGGTTCRITMVNHWPLQGGSKAPRLDTNLGSSFSLSDGRDNSLRWMVMDGGDGVSWRLRDMAEAAMDFWD